MKKIHKIIKIQLVLFLLLGIVSLFALGNIWLPFMVLLAIVSGPVMAYAYPWTLAVHLIISAGFLLSIILLWYGIKHHTRDRGVVAFIAGFWLWVMIALVYGLGTGT